MSLFAELPRAARSLARAPALVAVAVLSLGLGIGANATIFDFVNAIEFRPLPFPQSDRLMDVSEENARELCDGCGVGTAWPTFQVWRESARSFTGLGAYHEEAYALAGEGEPERVGGAAVTASVFSILGVAPVLGRQLTAEDDAPGAPGVVLLGYGLWIRRYGGDTTLIGKTVRVNGIVRTVVGVMPPRFGFPEFASLWLPMAGEDALTRSAEREIGVVGRLKTGVSEAQAGAEMASISARLAARDSTTYHGWTAAVGGLKQDISNDTSGEAFLLALGASGFVLLIACANLANLFLVRAASRARELAVRVALGASRGRIAAQVLAESTLLGLAGGVLGLLLSLWGVRFVTDLINSAMPFWIQLGVDWRFLLYTILLSLLAGLGFGLAPAIRASRIDLNEALKTGAAGVTAGRRDSRLRGTLAVAQIALAIVLLVGAGLMIKSFLVERNIEDLGYNPRGVLTARLQLASPRYRDPAQVRLLQDQLLERLRVQPMIESAAIERPVFLNSFVGTATRVRLEGTADPVPMGRGPGHGNAVTGDYFRMMEIPILSGRGIAATDREGAPPVVVVNHQAASLYWPGSQPIGKRLQIDRGAWLTVVGVAADVANHPFGRGSIPLLYTSAAQDSARPFRLMIRFHGEPATAAATLKAVARTVDADEPVEDVMTLEADLAQMVSPVRFMALLLGALGGIALALAAFGIYGTMSYLVTRRTRELGIRMALGADSRGLRRFVLSRGLRLALLGLGIGLPAAFGLTRLMRGLLFSVSPGDPMVFGAVGLLLAGIAVLACWRPARRATQVDPLEALRAE